MEEYQFVRITPKDPEAEAVNQFLQRHNIRGQGSTVGYVAYYAAIEPSGNHLPLVDRIVAAAKVCPMHTPTAAKFFAGRQSSAWKNVYILQRLAAYRAPENLLSKFLGWVLRECGKNSNIHFVSTYASTTDYSPWGRMNDGGIYRIVGGVYCGMTKGGRIEGFVHNGQRFSMRQGRKTLTKKDIPVEAKVLRAGPMHRYCWAVGPPLKRAFRRRDLAARMSKYQYIPFSQPRLLVRLRTAMAGVIELFKKSLPFPAR